MSGGIGSRVAASALALATVAGCAGADTDKPDALPRPEAPTTTTLSPDQIAECLFTGLFALDEAERLFYETGGPECRQYAKELLQGLGEYEQYSYLTDDINDEGNISAFQDRSGLWTGGVIDAITMQTMHNELRRLQAPPLEYDCFDPNQADTWSRAETVDRLAQMDAFSQKYSIDVTSRPDLLDPSKSSATLIRRVNEIIHFAGCNGIGFQVLIVNTAHGQGIHGNSQHPMGEAIDIRPFNGELAIPHWDTRSPVLPEQHISAYTEANAAAIRLMEFMAQDPSRYSQVIWTDSPFAIRGGQVVESRGAWDQAIADTHHDHIHIGINPSRP